jgi:hypothetical protein
MKNGQNPPERWAPELTTGESSLDGAVCSPSSDVPETLQAWRDYIESGLEEKLRDAAARMERERNEARKIAAELRDLVPWSESEPWNFSWENA